MTQFRIESAVADATCSCLSADAGVARRPIFGRRAATRPKFHQDEVQLRFGRRQRSLWHSASRWGKCKPRRDGRNVHDAVAGCAGLRPARFPIGTTAHSGLNVELFPCSLAFRRLNRPPQKSSTENRPACNAGIRERQKTSRVSDGRFDSELCQEDTV